MQRDRIEASGQRGEQRRTQRVGMRSGEDRGKAQRVPARQRGCGASPGLGQEQPGGALAVADAQDRELGVGMDMRDGQPEPVEPIVQDGLARTIERASRIGGDRVESC